MSGVTGPEQPVLGAKPTQIEAVPEHFRRI
jgi:hypothetical protein